MKRTYLLAFCLDQCRVLLSEYVPTSQDDFQKTQIKGHAYYTVAGLCSDAEKDDQTVKDTLWVLKKHCEVHNQVAYEVFSTALSFLLSA